MVAVVIVNAVGVCCCYYGYTSYMKIVIIIDSPVGISNMLDEKLFCSRLFICVYLWL